MTLSTLPTPPNTAPEVLHRWPAGGQHSMFVLSCPSADCLLPALPRLLICGWSNWQSIWTQPLVALPPLTTDLLWLLYTTNVSSRLLVYIMLVERCHENVKLIFRHPVVHFGVPWYIHWLEPGQVVGVMVVGVGLGDCSTNLEILVLQHLISSQHVILGQKIYHCRLAFLIYGNCSSK